MLRVVLRSSHLHHFLGQDWDLQSVSEAAADVKTISSCALMIVSVDTYELGE